MSGGPYEVIGRGHAAGRHTDQRIAARIWAALGKARSVVNIGAGSGSYEPPGRNVVAVEPSAVMRAQRPPSAAPCLAAAAESLPFADRCFGAAMSVLSDHHWADPLAGLAEMTRVARRVVVLQFDTSDPARFWLTRDYLPEFAHLNRGVPTLPERAAAIGARLEVVPVPGTAPTGSSTPTGAARAPTCGPRSVRPARYGPGPGLPSSSAPSASWPMTSAPAAGPSATARSPA